MLDDSELLSGVLPSHFTQYGADRVDHFVPTQDVGRSTSRERPYRLRTVYLSLSKTIGSLHIWQVISCGGGTAIQPPLAGKQRSIQSTPVCGPAEVPPHQASLSPTTAARRCRRRSSAS